MAFAQKKINVSFSLANGNFQGGGNSATLTGLRVSARLSAPGGIAMTAAEAAIYGLPLSMMNQLSTVGTQLDLIGKNTISIEAGDDTTGMFLIFKGTIIDAFVDAQAMPQVAFRVTAQAGAFEAAMTTPPISQEGTADVSSLMSQVAGAMGFQFENNGVSLKVTNPYLHGSPRSMAAQLAQMAGVEWVIERDTLAIWPPGQTRQGGNVLISPQTGMVGYPMFNQGGVLVRTLYNPALKYGGQITIQSDITPACGNWAIANMEVDIEAQTPRGKWFALLFATPIGPADVPSTE